MIIEQRRRYASDWYQRLTLEEKAARNARARDWHRRTYPQKKAEVRARANKWTTRNPGRQKYSMLRLNYGLSIPEYWAHMRRQGGVCALCERDFSRTPHVDHDHTTGRVRGILCSECNHQLGFVEKCNAAWLFNARHYLAP